MSFHHSVFQLQQYVALVNADYYIRYLMNDRSFKATLGKVSILVDLVIFTNTIGT